MLPDVISIEIPPTEDTLVLGPLPLSSSIRSLSVLALELITWPIVAQSMLAMYAKEIKELSIWATDEAPTQAFIFHPTEVVKWSVRATVPANGAAIT
jgi:hypothetical protein